MGEIITANAVGAAMRRAAEALVRESGRLNDLDQAMGDGFDAGGGFDDVA